VSGARVFLGGEGQNELGSRCGHPAHQSDDSPGVIAALLARTRPHGWTVIGACKWCDIRKLRARGPTPRDEQNVLGLTFEAARARADVLAFTRDADGDSERPRVIEKAVASAQLQFSTVAIVGAAAVPVLEGWILALLGESGTEALGKAAAQRRLAETHVEEKNTRAMVEVVANADMQRIPKDAVGLHGWLARVKEALGAAGAGG